MKFVLPLFFLGILGGLGTVVWKLLSSLGDVKLLRTELQALKDLRGKEIVWWKQTISQLKIEEELLEKIRQGLPRDDVNDLLSGVLPTANSS